MPKLKSSIFFALLVSFLTNTLSNTLIPEPSNLNDYVQTADVIIVGSITNVEKIHNFYGYQSDAADRETYEKNLIKKGVNLPFSLGIPLVDFKIHIDEVIKSDGYLDNYKSNSIVYRKYIGNNIIMSSKNSKDLKGSYVFFLNRNPDNETYGIQSASRQIEINASGEALKYTTDKQEIRVLKGRFDGMDFLKLVRDEVAKESLNK